LGRCNSVATSRDRFDGVRRHAAQPGRPIKRSGRSINNASCGSVQSSFGNRKISEPKAGSAIKKYERWIIPNDARTSEKSA
jgi:hypothetical protein